MAPPIRLLLVDSLNLVRRVHAAQPGDDEAARAEEARIACGRSLERALREAEPTHAVVVFEDSAPTWRHRLHPDYKAGHDPMPLPLREALPRYRETFAAAGVVSVELPGTEADDVIATFAVKCARAGGTVRILSTDRIYLQLLGPRIEVRDHFASRTLDGSAVAERFGVAPERLRDLFALTGHAASDVPGVPGVGPKTAARLLAVYPGLEDVLEAAATRGVEAPELTPKLAERLVTHAEDARLAHRLLGLRTDLELGIRLSRLRYRL